MLPSDVLGCQSAHKSGSMKAAEKKRHTTQFHAAVRTHPYHAIRITGNSHFWSFQKPISNGT